MTILLSDPRVSAVPVRECGEHLVVLDASFGPARVLVRAGVADRLCAARELLPHGIGLRVFEGHRSVADQRAIIARYSAEVCAVRPGVSARDLHELVSLFVSPVEVEPHVAGAAVDLTLVDALGDELDPAHRQLLSAVLTPVGFVNHPTEWWHWSHGDRYWALVTGAPGAVYGPHAGVLVAGSGAA